MLTRRASRLRFHLALPRVFQIAWLSLAATIAHAQTPPDTHELQKKAEYINSFTRFVDWPARKFADPNAPFVIGIYGTDNISAALQGSIQDRQIKGRPTLIKHLLNKQELRACHVLFISRSETDRLGPILGEVRREGVLTVGECDNFLGKGGVINFVSVGGQVRFQINPDSAAREKLIFSSKLLQLAVPFGINLPVGGMKLSDGLPVK
jgi:hypothetical protein